MTITEMLLFVLLAVAARSTPLNRDEATDVLLKKDCALLLKATKDTLKESEIGIDCWDLPIEDTKEYPNQAVEENPVEVEEEPRVYPVFCPTSEPQLDLWPSHVDDVADVLQSSGPLYMATPSWAQQIGPSNGIPLYEDQIVVYPAMNEEDAGPSIDTEIWPVALGSTSEKPTSGHVEVVEKYQVVHPNGTSEYKLSLTNGLVVYKKIYKKIANDGKEVVVQEGYDSVPVAGKEDEFLTQFYIADEQGYNVYKVEHNPRRPSIPMFLSYQDQPTVQEK